MMLILHNKMDAVETSPTYVLELNTALRGLQRGYIPCSSWVGNVKRYSLSVRLLNACPTWPKVTLSPNRTAEHVVEPSVH